MTSSHYVLTRQLHTFTHRIHRTSPHATHITMCGVHVHGANNPPYPPPPDALLCGLCFTKAHKEPPCITY